MGSTLRLRIAVNQNKYDLAGITITNLSVVSKDFRAARSLERVVLQPKTSQMLNVIGSCLDICVIIHRFETRRESSETNGLLSTLDKRRNR